MLLLRCALPEARDIQLLLTEGGKEPQPAAYCHRWQLGEGPRTLEEGRGAVNSTSSLWHGGLEGKVQLTLFFCPHLQGHLPLQKKCTRGKVHLAEMNENGMKIDMAHQKLDFYAQKTKSLKTRAPGKEGRKSSTA